MKKEIILNCVPPSSVGFPSPAISILKAYLKKIKFILFDNKIDCEMATLIEKVETTLSSLRIFIISCLLLSAHLVFAQDVITFTWQAGIYPKDFDIWVTKDKTFTVNWGDGSDIETFTGMSTYLKIIHTYNAANNYLVTLTANSETCKFIGFICDYKQLSNLNASGCTELQYLYCNDNQLTSIDVSGCTKLQFLRCQYNYLTSLDVSNNKALILLLISHNLITSLDLSNLTMLKFLYAQGNQITSIELNDCVILETLDCSDNQLKSLDVSNNKGLKSLNCSHNQLTNLNLSNNTKLQELFCYNNQLSGLNVNNCRGLEYLYCHNNQIPYLDVTNSKILKELYCSNNQLTSLTASGCARLLYLYCFNNKLSLLDIGGCTRLEYLYGYNNQLTNLDISSCKTIKDLWVYNNRLPLSDLFVVSEKINAVDSKLLGSQTLLPQQVMLGKTLFSNQSVFNGVLTNYTVTKNGNPAPENDYTIADGKITFNKLGIYTLTMRNDAIVSNIFYPASVTVDLMVVEDAGIEENGETNIRVYPNPTTGELRITNYELGIGSLSEVGVEVFDVYGRKQSHVSRVTRNEKNISELPAGIYFVKITTEKGVVTKKVIKY